MHDEALAMHRASRPAVASVLPSDPEAIAWQEGEDSILAERDKLLALLETQPQTNVVATVFYEGPTGTIATLEIGRGQPAHRA